jgi:ribonuclease R
MSKNKHKKGKDTFQETFTLPIIQYLTNNPNQSFNYKQLAFQLNIVDDYGKGQLAKLLAELVEKGQIKETDKGKFKISHQSHYYEGKMDITMSGKAYFICDELENDIHIPGRNLNHALHGDQVRVYSYHRQRSNTKREGDVVEILKRAKTEFVGTIQLHKNHAFVIPDDVRMYSDFFIPLKHVNDAKDGDKVVVKLTDWPANSKNPFGKILDVLGKPGDHNTEIHSILLEYGLPYKFPDGVEEEANEINIEITAEEIAKRRDMRQALTFTIDPKDAKDFDDAISFEILPNGHYEIGIHIADVSHYVVPGTKLDKEAYNRATSVYLVDRVVPMLPEILSNNVCSLRPNEDKLTFSAVFEMNRKAEVIKQWFGRTIIHSDKRYAYEDAQEIIEKNEKESDKTSLEFAILELDALAKILRGKRVKAGAITFDKLEVRFELNTFNEPIQILFKHSKDANKLIEEFMLLANRKVAEFIGQKSIGVPSNKTFVYRIHDEPNVEKLAQLQQIIGKFGYKIDTRSTEKLAQSLNKLLEDIKDKPEENMIETLTIRSMAKAIYTTKNIGHYGLAFEYYTHFTSPIRRYPDVMVHRLLQHYLDGKKSPAMAVYEEQSKHSSEREGLATKAERDSIKYMQVKYMQNHVHEQFEGVVSGVTEWGIFVELTDNMCEGLVRTKEIKDDYYLYDEKQVALVGQATKNLIRLGDKVKVKVKHTDLEKKQLDFTLVD